MRQERLKWCEMTDYMQRFKMLEFDEGLIEFANAGLLKELHVPPSAVATDSAAAKSNTRFVRLHLWTRV